MREMTKNFFSPYILTRVLIMIQYIVCVPERNSFICVLQRIKVLIHQGQAGGKNLRYKKENSWWISPAVFFLYPNYCSNGHQYARIDK